MNSILTGRLHDSDSSGGGRSALDAALIKCAMAVQGRDVGSHIIASPGYDAELSAWKDALETPLGPYSGRNELVETVDYLTFDDGDGSTPFLAFRTFAMLVGLALQTRSSSGWDACLVPNYVLYRLICDARSLE